jgi:predicted ATP-dependent serine protease
LNNCLPESFAWDILEPIMVKGKAEPVPIYRPAKAEKKSMLWGKLKQSVKPQKIYGRMKQTAAISKALSKPDGVILIQGEPGIGTSTER